jgi:hypothetical protein
LPITFTSTFSRPRCRRRYAFLDALLAAHLDEIVERRIEIAASSEKLGRRIGVR